jgi:uncharacterized membrane protein
MRPFGFDSTIGRLMIAMTYISVGLLLVGVVLMLVNGISPLDQAPVFDPGLIWAELQAGMPVGFLWLGLIVVIATPIVRVAASAVGYARLGEWRMVGVGTGILFVIAVGIITSIVVEH